MSLRWRLSILRVFALALVAVSPLGCGARNGPHARTPATSDGASHGVDIASFRGHVRLDPRAQFQFAEGDVFLHVYSLDGTVFDGLLCYPRPDRCETLELKRENAPDAWSATLSDALPDSTPFVLSFDVPPGGDFSAATRVHARVVAAGLGEIGEASLTRDRASQPPRGVRERLRGEQRLRRVYEALSVAYRLADPSERVFPASHPETPSPPPCGPTWVRDPDAVAWLGVSTPVVLSWGFSVEADAAQGTLRVIARRDVSCHGDLEKLVLTARVDEDGDLERVGIERTGGADTTRH